MGYWQTLHLFDDQKFYNQIVPQLKGKAGGLENSYLEFIRTHIIGGTSQLTKEEVNKLIEEHLKSLFLITNTLDEDFKTPQVFQSIKDHDSQIEYMNKLDGYYDFCKFLEYYVFKTCADFFPHIPLGKGDVSRNFNLRENTIASSVVYELDNYDNFLCGPDRMGITNWISYENVEFLFLDKENLHFDNPENNRAKGFLTLLHVAQKNKIGFIMGRDMRENVLERLTSYKLASKGFWTNLPKNGLLFER